MRSSTMTRARSPFEATRGGVDLVLGHGSAIARQAGPCRDAYGDLIAPTDAVPSARPSGGASGTNPYCDRRPVFPKPRRAALRHLGSGSECRRRDPVPCLAPSGDRTFAGRQAGPIGRNGQLIRVPADRIGRAEFCLSVRPPRQRPTAPRAGAARASPSRSTGVPITRPPVPACRSGGGRSRSRAP